MEAQRGRRRRSLPGQRHVRDERTDDGGATNGNLNGRSHGYRIPVSCTRRRRRPPRARSGATVHCTLDRAGRPGHATPGAQSSSWLDPYREPAARLIAESQSSHFAWERLALLGDTFGHRLCWIRRPRQRHHVGRGRNEEGWPRQRAHRTSQGAALGARTGERGNHLRRTGQPLACSASATASGRPPTASKPTCSSSARSPSSTRPAPTARGKIVLFNVPFTNYGETVQYRAAGPSRAAALGAVAMLIRAVGPPGLRTPHTGSLRYADGHAADSRRRRSRSRTPSGCSACRTAARRSGSG